jgi:hypothetical protein
VSHNLNELPHKSSFRQKSFTYVIGCGTVVEIFLQKIVKTKGGHRALGSLRAGSISAQVQGHSLLNLQSSRTFINMAIDKFFELKDM